MTTLKIKLIVNGEEVETDAVITVDEAGNVATPPPPGSEPWKQAPE